MLQAPQHKNIINIDLPFLVSLPTATSEKERQPSIGHVKVQALRLPELFQRAKNIVLPDPSVRSHGVRDLTAKRNSVWASPQGFLDPSTR